MVEEHKMIKIYKILYFKEPTDKGWFYDEPVNKISIERLNFLRNKKADIKIKTRIVVEF